MPFASVRDLDMYYELHGDHGPNVVLISGTGGDLRTNPRRGHGVLESACRVLMYDQRGLGRTSKPDRPTSIEEYADDCAALMDVIGWSSAHVVGISFGGMVAQHVALRHPDRVDRLVLACTSSGGAGGASFDLLAVDRLTGDDRRSIMLPLMDTRNEPDADPPVVAPMFDLLGPYLSAPRPNSDEPDAAIGARRQLEARAGHDTWARLPEITAPTLVVGGRFDGQAPPENLERLAGRIPDSRLEFFDGGHLFLLQDATAWPRIVTFLGSPDTS